MKSDIFKPILIALLIIIVAVWAISWRVKEDTKRWNQRCEAMLALANDLPDSLKVVKIDNFCLRYIR